MAADNAGHSQYTSAAREQAGAVNELKQVYSDLAEQQIRDYERVASAQAGANKELEQGTKGTRSLGDAMGALKGQLAAVAAAAAAVAAAVKFVGDETARLDGIAKSAQKSGLGFEAFQRLQHVATLSGTSIEAVSKASLKLNLNLREIGDGGGKQAARALSELGISAQSLAGLSETEQFAVIAGQLQKVGDESTRSAIAFELFGKSGTELIPMLNAGADGVREMSDAVGRVFTREELARAEAYQDSLANLNRSIDVAKGQLAVALAPAFQEVAERMTAGANEAQKYLPALVKYLENILRGIEPVVRYVSFFAEQMATLGRVMDLASGAMDRGIDRAREFGDSLLETEAGKWAIEAKDSLVAMADEGIQSITDAVQEHIPFAEDLADAWDTVGRAISGATGEAHEFGLIAKGQALLNDLLNKGKGIAQDQDEIEAAKLAKLEQAATYAEHAVRLAEAQGKPARELEWLYRNQVAAKVELLKATGKQAELEKTLRDEAVRQAGATARRGGGRGPSDADKMRAAGEAQLQNWQAQLRLAELQSELVGDAANQANYLAGVRHNLAVQELELERQVLEVTRARNSVERQQRDTKLAVVEASLEELALEKQLAEQAQARAEAQAWRDEWVASVQAEQQSLGNVVELEQYRLDQRARQAEDEGRLAEASALRIQQAQLREEQMQRELELRRQLVLAEAPEGEAERIQQQMELEQIAHQQRMAIVQRDSEVARLQNAERQRLHDLEEKRKAEAWKNAQRIASASENLTRQTMGFTSFAVDAMIKDEGRREKAKLRAEGVMAIATAARQQVEAVASFASFNYVQGALQQAAAVFGFAQGAMMLAGIVPGGGGGGAAAASASGRTPRDDRDTSAAATTPDSVPAADRAPQRLGGRSAASASGGVTIVIEGDVAGDVSQGFAEKMARALKDAGNGTQL